MEVRMLIASVLALAVLAGYYYLVPPQPPPATQRKAAETARQTTIPAANETEPPKVVVQAKPGKMPAGAITSSAEETFVVETSLYRVEFTNRGARVKSWVLKKYKDSAGKPLDLVSPTGAKKIGYPLALRFKGQQPSTDLGQALFSAKKTADGLGVNFEFSNGRTYARKSVSFQRDNYQGEISTEVLENGAPVPHLIGWRGGFGDAAVQSPHAVVKSLYFNTGEQKLEYIEAKESEEGPKSISGNYAFVGLEDQYFALVFLPQGNGSTELQSITDWTANSDGKDEMMAGAAVGGEAKNRLGFFAGPKDKDVLARVDKRLEGLVTFGFWTFLAKPLFIGLTWVNDKFVHNYGWSIILVTVIINFLLLPLKVSSLKSMRKMSLLQPEMQAINERFKGVSMKDPKAANKNAEVMDLYKKHGVNPAGGCLPMLLQFPFLFAFYAVLSATIEMRGAQWLWLGDLSNFDPTYALPIVMVGTQFVLQKMTPMTGGDPMQQRMMMFMPLIFGFMFMKAQSGLVLYWLTGNLVGIVQQWGFNKLMPAPSPVQVVKPASGKTSNGKTSNGKTSNVKTSGKKGK